MRIRRDGSAAPGQSAVTVVANDVGTIGGMEGQLKELVAELLNRRWHVTVIARTCLVPSHPQLQWVRVPGPGRPFSIAFPWFALCASILLWRRGRGIVHTTGAIVANRSDLSTVHLCHAGISTKTDLVRARSTALHYRINGLLGARMSRAAERWCYRPGITRLLVTVSKGAADEIGHHFPAMRGAVAVIPNSVDAHRFRPNPEARERVREELSLAPDAFVVLFVGGDWERKGLAVAIRAVARVQRSHLVVVGAGDTHRFRRIAEETRVGDRTHFVGVIGHVQDLYAAADVFLLPSRYETFSMVTYEAAATSLPLLVTRVSGVEEILVDGVNGRYITCDPEAIAERLRTLRDDTHLRTSMGAKSRDLASHFAQTNMVDRYEELYRRLHSPSAPGLGATRP